ncbi:jg17081 [Pararge aegeria aegeria]|uniref:Jg17081 protein n=1 Tax=Pararge aegeria aegeria TaxID=348720 RepID=A0A8S4R6K2_9NEOP|nr:jg17081 [Pararge aegeria aegeria]
MTKEILVNSGKENMRKVNVLAKIVIPRLNVTSHYILSELEEKEREEVFRLKRVKQKKDSEKKLDEMQRRAETVPKAISAELVILKSENEPAPRKKPEPNIRNSQQ